MTVTVAYSSADTPLSRLVCFGDSTSRDMFAPLFITSGTGTPAYAVSRQSEGRAPVDVPLEVRQTAAGMS